MAKKAKRREWTASDVRNLKSFAKKEDTCWQDCKVFEKNGWRDEAKSIFTWPFVGCPQVVCEGNRPGELRISARDAKSFVVSNFDESALDQIIVLLADSHQLREWTLTG